jgi:uncharacterized protein involved in exopolysaccharide biosynthesis
VDRYLRTFSRHKIALLLPVILALTMSVWYAKSASHKYETSMNLWFDTPTPSASSLVSPPGAGAVTPAQQGQTVLQEFLGTGQFLVDVGRGGPLASYLEHYHPVKKGPGALISKLESVLGKKASSGSTPSPQAINGEIGATLAKAFKITVTGPQVVSVTMTSSNPSYMPGTLNALATQYVNKIAADLSSRAAATVRTYTTELQGAQQVLNTATAQLNQYMQTHPTAATTNNPSSAYSNLVQAVDTAQTNVETDTNNLAQARLPIASATSDGTFKVIDAAGPPGQLSSKKHMIFTIVVGFMAGLVISIIALCALTALDKTARRREDIDGTQGMEVVATIGHLPRPRRLPSLTKEKSS